MRAPSSLRSLLIGKRSASIVLTCLCEQTRDNLFYCKFGTTFGQSEGPWRRGSLGSSWSVRIGRGVPKLKWLRKGGGRVYSCHLYQIMDICQQKIQTLRNTEKIVCKKGNRRYYPLRSPSLFWMLYSKFLWFSVINSCFTLSNQVYRKISYHLYQL